MLVSFFSSNISLYIEKNSVEQLCKVLEMELKTYTESVQNSFSRKSNLKFCIIFNMISFANAQDLVKIRLACSKDLLLINCFLRRFWNSFKKILLKAPEHEYIFLKYSRNLNISEIFWASYKENNFPIIFPKYRKPHFLASIEI